ncbi:hypothetical protein GQ43DRAFT_474390 [Delitschia confertaspora ATCC 74209]|uniref:Uncharacterized protein n=1 Tax=Delitschia confertaspora ATCC 74209 TaxID=1513339 RepID=A0A9P4JFQ4_9PLEO|nr:hypothetical protein GQ43DRAFT_474390 [Delitschia confertaspora ATCC 74209]
MSFQDAVRAYDIQMHPRARTAVEISRQAGFDAHDYNKVNTEGSFALLGENPTHLYYLACNANGFLRISSFLQCRSVSLNIMDLNLIDPF